MYEVQTNRPPCVDTCAFPEGNVHATHCNIATSYGASAAWQLPYRNAAKPLLVLLHGFGGTYHGLLPLARALAKNWRVIILEMPNHGASQLVDIVSSQQLQAWAHEALAEISKQYGKPTAVVAHSFGCGAFANPAITRRYPTVMLCPVPTPSYSFRIMARSAIRSSFLSRLQNTPHLAVVKGMALLKRQNQRAVQFVGWNSRCFATPTADQLEKQRHMLRIALEHDLFSPTTLVNTVRLVVAGAADTTATQRTTEQLQAVFGARTHVHVIEGGHLLFLEAPEELAELITSHTLQTVRAA